MKRICHQCKLSNLCVIDDKIKNAANHFVRLSEDPDIFKKIQQLIAERCRMFESVDD